MGLPNCALEPLYVKQMIPGDTGWVDARALAGDVLGQLWINIHAELCPPAPAGCAQIWRTESGYAADLARAGRLARGHADLSRGMRYVGTVTGVAC